MRDFVFTFTQNKRRLSVHMLYLPDTHIWEMFIDVPVENTLHQRVQGSSVTKAIPVYDTMNDSAENVYHSEDWSVDAGEFWDWVQDHELNLTFAGGGDDVYPYTQGEREFYNDSDDGYFALASWVTEWVSEEIILLDS